MPNLKHFDSTGTIRFVTFSCFQRRPYLSYDNDRDHFLTFLLGERAVLNYKLFGFVIMPEHVHLVLLPADESLLGTIIGRLKGKSARMMLPSIRERYGKRYGTIDSLWAKRCYDYNCRTTDEAIEKIEYCHKNPVTRGLTKSPGEWKWSSHGWYEGNGQGSFGLDEL